MSLVAYGASDDEDSDSSLTGNEQSITKVTSSHEYNKSEKPVSPGHISDEDDYHPTYQTHKKTDIGHKQVSSTSLSKSGDAIDILAKIIHENSSAEESTTSTSLKNLPAPQKGSVLMEDDLEEEVKPKEREIADAPKPPSKKSKQPVKITIPALEETSEEETQSSKKNVTSSTKKSGLFSLLPAPIHSSKKEINRALIPHSLGKKAPTAVSTKKPPSQALSSSSVGSNSTEADNPRSKHMSQFNALTGYDSDSDDEEPVDTGSSGDNFFSIDSSTIQASASLSKDNSETAFITNSSKNVQSQEISSSGVSVETVSEKSTSQTVASADAEETKPIVAVPEPGAVNDAPLDFGLGHSGSSHWAGRSSLSHLSPVGRSEPNMAPFSHSTSTMYNLAHNMEQDAPSVQEDVDFEPVPDDDLRKFMSDKEFQRLQGKRKRGMEEDINFVDANVDDYVDPSELAKHLTEETEYVSHKSKDNLPTSQQKRKKQITYLAHQAKERELELKNQWAQNRHTKKQTQSKYGF